MARLRLRPWIGVAGATPRDERQRLAHVLTGRAGRDLRWSLNAARTDLLYGVGCHLPITGLHASATRHVGEIFRRSTPDHFLLRGGARDALGISCRIRGDGAGLGSVLE